MVDPAASSASSRASVRSTLPSGSSFFALVEVQKNYHRPHQKGMTRVRTRCRIRPTTSVACCRCRSSRATCESSGCGPSLRRCHATPEQKRELLVTTLTAHDSRVSAVWRGALRAAHPRTTVSQEQFGRFFTELQLLAKAKASGTIVVTSWRHIRERASHVRCPPHGASSSQGRSARIL
jgi:hypothetical protein